MTNLTGPTHAEVRDRLLDESSAELREEYARLGLRRAAIAALVRARMKRKLTQHELAERMGVSQGVVSRLEAGAHSPKLETLELDARAMDFRWEIKLVDERRGRSTPRREARRKDGLTLRTPPNHSRAASALSSIHTTRPVRMGSQAMTYEHIAS